jgi:hypothetical protein
MSNSSSPSLFDLATAPDSDSDWEIDIEMETEGDDVAEYYEYERTPSKRKRKVPPTQPPLAVIRDDVHNRPRTRRRISGGFGKGKKSSGGSSTVKVSGRAYKVQKGPRGGKFIRRGGKKVYISSKK